MSANQLIEIPTQPPGDDANDADETLETLCKQCQEVDWRNLATWGSFRGSQASESFWNARGTKVIRVFRERLRTDLVNSSCRICRLVGHLANPQIPDEQRLNICFEACKPLTGWHNDKEGHTPLVKLAVRSPATDTRWPRGDEHDYTRFLLAHKFKNNENLGIRNLKSSGVNYNFCNQQLENCLKNHKECQSQRKEVNGLQLIDVHTGKVISAPPGCTYVALSYVLGGYPTALETYPPVVQDAMAATKELNCKYLWVDQYCIKQQDESHKRAMILQMDQIYSNAYFTIIAAFGSSASDGLPGVGNLPRYQGRAVIGKIQLVQLSSTGSDTLKLSTWATRGWTYQEGFLSKRRLIFMKDEVFFLCNTDFAKETEMQYGIDRYEMMNVKHRISAIGESNIHEHHVMDSFRWMIPHAKGNHGFWVIQNFLERLIETYSERNLTEENDSLNAFLGILKHYESNEMDAEGPVSHFWGIPLKQVKFDWGEQLRFHLSWKSDSILKRRSALPSWSWCGWGGSIQFHGTGYSRLEIQPATVDIWDSGRRERFEDSTTKYIVRIGVRRDDQLIDLQTFIRNRLASKIEEEDPKELSIASFIVPLRFCVDSTIQLSGPRSSAIGRREGPVTLLKFVVRPGVFLGVPVRFNREYDHSCQKLGLVLPVDGQFPNNSVYNIIVLHARKDGKYERAGIASLHYVASDGSLQSFGGENRDIYLNEEDQPIEEERGRGPPNKYLFLENAEWRTICLV